MCVCTFYFQISLPGDKVIAREHSALDVVYEGEVISLKGKNLICVHFKDDFVKSFNNRAYVVDFDFPRVQWIRLHFAIDMAINTLGLDILNPKEILLREQPLLNVRLSSKGFLTSVEDNGVLKWFDKSLNTEQKETVAHVLRGDLLTPYIIYGPPGDTCVIQYFQHKIL